ncbi:unnamed protein product [Cyprideis torosa]|uniref:Uncharacterized protein n=1 Tax=Cyprideis torosa TaxID=163714 RepID=A0A7R8W1W1_9CRUS|nr:unnamed protein product [Cyprideis torosa]CAG0880270.1 unnamed protein product [Cyprideis torosa]
MAGPSWLLPVTVMCAVCCLCSYAGFPEVIDNQLTYSRHRTPLIRPLTNDRGGPWGVEFSDGAQGGARVKRQVTQHINPPIQISPLPRGPVVRMPPISFREVGAAVTAATISVDRRFQETEPKIVKSGVRQIPKSPAWFMAASAKTKVVAKNISRIALISEEATKIIAEEYKLTKQQITYGLPTADVRETILGEACPVQVDFPCQPRKYRAYNGYCNNVQNPRWGNANTRYLRFLPPNYADGVSTPRQADTGDFLASARDVSLVLHRDVDQPHPHMTALSAIWSEFLTHDITHTPHMAGFLGQRLRCCGIKFEFFHPECYPIRIPDNDPVYSKINERCQEYTRSGNAPRTGCTLGPREQLNQVTSFLDGSVIYGSSKEEVAELRTNKGGLLRVQSGPAGDLPPADENDFDCRNHTQLKCFKSGDVRSNEHLGLASMHTLWLREHNRIAKILSVVNPHWGDEQLFQEARRVVAAQLQHITYNEFLPSILGLDVVSRYGLQPQRAGFFTGYDININPGIANSVATAALRFVTSLMLDKVPFLYQDGSKEEKAVGQSFFAPFDLYEPGKLEALLRGLLDTRAQTEDPFISSSMTNHLFFDPVTGIGLDLAAQIIQQGRDHGLEGYNAWREFCGRPRARTFDDLKDVMSLDSLRALQSTYADVNDIDLFSGGLAEVPNRGALVGPTFGCLLGRQFHYLRRGDRYWYENDVPPSSFTKEQLYEIRKTSLARVICDNSDVELVQPHVFIQHDPFLNAPMACNGPTIGSVNLKKWGQISPNFIVPGEVLLNSVQRAKRDIGEMKEQELEKAPAGQVDPKSPIGSQFGFLRPKRQALDISESSFLLQFASKRFVNNLINDPQKPIKDLEGGSKAPKDLQELMSVLPNIDVTDVMDIPQVFKCDEQTLPCDHTSQFPTLTGWCNNLLVPEYGKSMRAFARLIRPRYEDGLSEPRSKSVTGQPLPTPRAVSLSIHDDVAAPHVRYTLLTMQFAQFLDHDITFTPVNKGPGDTILNCRRCDSAQLVHPECLPIQLPPQDPYYPRINQTSGLPFCIPFTRSLPGQLTLGYREQLNQVTAFVDASAVYGSDLCEARALRSFRGGRLATQPHPAGQKELMPVSTEGDEECRSPRGHCFHAGDGRNSEQPGLAAIHTVFVREHNRMADQLASLNSHWDFFFNPDKLYEPDMIDELMRGFTTIEMENLDNHVTEEVTNHLFEDRRIPFSGMDLPALNIQRARDHGIAPYNEYRALCNLTRAKDFSDLSREVSQSMIQRLRSLYAHVDDIDLFPGGLSETPLHGGLVGPTFGCILGVQFRNLMRCDRFWYENGDPLTRFTEAQLNEIRQITFGKLICQNSDAISLIQRSVFDLPDPFLNPRVPCTTLPGIDLGHWKEFTTCSIGDVRIGVGQADRISPCVMCTCTKEGPICQSLKIDNCFLLAKSFTPQDILKDHVCKVQCAFAFRAIPKVRS